MCSNINWCFLIMPHFNSIDEYVASFPKNVQIALDQIRQVVKEATPKAEEAISYNMPAFKLKGNLVWFGAFHRITLVSIPVSPQLKRSEKN